MARRTLGLSADVQPTVTGGLTFFGAPLNTYMTHAACAMVRRVRGGAKLGLLYGKGGFVTKHFVGCEEYMTDIGLFNQALQSTRFCKVNQVKPGV